MFGGVLGVGCEREGGLRDKVFYRDFDGVNFVVVNGDAVDDGFVAEAADLEDELERGLGVSVAECVIGCCRGVPFGGEWLWVLGVGCGFCRGYLVDLLGGKQGECLPIM